jgi:hypothetical protein
VTDRWELVRQIADVEVDLFEQTGQSISAMIYPAGSWRDTRSPLMHEIRREGRVL